MAIISKISHKRVLIIEDMPEARRNVMMNLSPLGFGAIHPVATIKEAMERMDELKYDVILCDYNLGDGTNGHQFLEYLRSNAKIPRGSIFIMITGESSYESVASAAEFAPDYYLLKPFTASQLINRISSLIDKQDAMNEIDGLVEKKKWGATLKVCNAMMEKKDKYFFEAAKIKATALVNMNRSDEAIDLYQSILDIREVTWAKLGLASIMAKTGKYDEAKAISKELLVSNPNLVANLELMSDLLMKDNDPEKALGFLRRASTICPGNMKRTRSQASISMMNGDYQGAEEIIAGALKKHKHSPLKESSDYVLLAKSMAEQGKGDDAIKVIFDAKSQFKSPLDEVLLSAGACVVYNKTGNTAAAAAEERNIANANLGELPPSVSIAIAEAYMSSGDDDKATEILTHVVQNNPENIELISKVKVACSVSGKSMGDATNLINKSLAEITKVNNEGVRKAKEGRYAEATELIIRAAEKMPDNITITANAAIILAASLPSLKQRELLVKCIGFRKKLSDFNPDHPAIKKVDDYLNLMREAAHE